MPVIKCSNGKWKIGQNGPCIYTSKAKAERAYAGYRARVREVTTSADIAARLRKRKKRRKVRKTRAPGMTLRYTMNASGEDLDALVEQAVGLALDRASEDLKGEHIESMVGEFTLSEKVGHTRTGGKAALRSWFGLFVGKRIGKRKKGRTTSTFKGRGKYSGRTYKLTKLGGGKYRLKRVA